MAHGQGLNADSPALLLSVAEMVQADSAAIAAGTPGTKLMESAGKAVAEVVRKAHSDRPIFILCGPGNNGGDGYVAARYLESWGLDVTVAALGELKRLKGDAAWAFETWNGPVTPIDDLDLSAHAPGTVIVDALFGAGLTRPLEGVAAQWAETTQAAMVSVIAVDVPSGVNGTTGGVDGSAFKATDTVTFCRAKPGHYLGKGRALCGQVHVVDIGIPDPIIAGLSANVWANDPTLWAHQLPALAEDDHKYSRGHAVIWGGTDMPGAAHLAAAAARRVGAGMVTIACETGALTGFKAGQPGVLAEDLGDPDDFGTFLDDPRRRAVLVGPGAGCEGRGGKGSERSEKTGRSKTQARVLAALSPNRTTIIDADGISAFAGEGDKLFQAIQGRVILTPHEGEFYRLFGDLPGDKLTRTRRAADISGCIVLLKGPDTVIAEPSTLAEQAGRAIINTNGTPLLATAGSGDVLAGLILGLVVQGMDPFPAAAAATWLHAAAARRFGRGVIAEDLSEQIPPLLQEVTC